MNKKLLYLFLIVAGLFMGKTANAITITVTLTDDLEVPGYVKSNYLDLVGHTLNGEGFDTGNQTTITMGDVIRREGYGIQDQKAGARSVTVNLAIKAGDIVILQGGQTATYGIEFSIPNAEETTIAGCEDYYCFNVADDAENFDVSLNRNNYISAILIMTKDASADELEVAKSNYASAVTAYNSAKEAAVVDEEFVDDTKLFWHPTSALTAYNAAISSADEEFAKEQYDRLKDNYLKKFPFTGFKEYNNRYCLFGVDIDAGPIIFNLSPSGTAFATGSVTYFNDLKLRRKLLKTAEIAGTTISCRGKRHYLLADVALVGEAIMLAMRTNVNM